MKFLKKNLEAILLTLFFGFLLIIILTTYKDFGVTWDEKFYLDVGKYYGTLILNFFHIPNNLGESPFQSSYFLLHIKGHGVFFDVLGFFLSLLFNKFTVEANHLLKALLSLPTFIFLYLTIKKLLNWKIAFIGIILLLSSPYFYGNMFFNAIDIPTALVLSGTLYFFTNVFFTKTKATSQVLLSFFLALLITQRIIFLYAFVVIILSMFIDDWHKKGKFFAFKKNAIITVLTLLFAHLLHPYLLAHPIKGIFDMLKSGGAYPWSATILFEGSYVYPKSVAWYYLPKTIFITMPLITTFLFLFGNYYLLRRLFLKNEKKTYKLFYLSILIIFYLPVCLTIFLKPVIYDSWRHFLFLLIPIIIVSSYGLYFVTQLKQKFLRVIIFLLVILNIFTTTLTMINLHPYEYVYYNMTVGGLKGAYRQYETDYWGEGFKEAVIWFNKNINKSNKNYLIKVEGDPYSSTPYFKNNMVLVNDQNKADYVFTFTRWNLDLAYSGKIIHEVVRAGVPLIIIKEGGR